MRKMFYVFVLLICIHIGAHAQKASKVVVNVQKQEVDIGTQKITINTSIDEVIKYFGAPERKETIAGKERIFAYDQLGIAFDIGVSGKRNVEMVAFTYNPDGDRKVAKGIFAGELTVDGLKVVKTTKSKEIATTTKLEIQCFSTMCVSNPAGKGLALLVGYTNPEQAEIGQIGFGFKP